MWYYYVLFAQVLQQISFLSEMYSARSDYLSHRVTVSLRFQLCQFSFMWSWQFLYWIYVSFCQHLKSRLKYTARSDCLSHQLTVSLWRGRILKTNQFLAEIRDIVELTQKYQRKSEFKTPNYILAEGPSFCCRAPSLWSWDHENGTEYFH